MCEPKETRTALFNQLTICEDIVLLNGNRVDWVESVDVKNINPDGPMDVTIHLAASQVDIRYAITE